MKLGDLVIGEAYAHEAKAHEARDFGHARKAYYLGRCADQRAISADSRIEWFLDRSRPVSSDPEVIVAIQYDRTGLTGGRLTDATVNHPNEIWRPGLVGRRHLVCPWAEFEARIEELRVVRERYADLSNNVRVGLERAGIRGVEIHPTGSWQMFEPENVIVRAKGDAAAELAHSFPEATTIEVRATDILERFPP